MNQILCEGDPSQAVAFNGLAGTVYQWDATPTTNAIDIGMLAASEQEIFHHLFLTIQALETLVFLQIFKLLLNLTVVWVVPFRLVF